MENKITCICLFSYLSIKLNLDFSFSNQSINYFYIIITPCKISEPYDNAFWEKSKRGGKKRKKTPVIVDT